MAKSLARDEYVRFQPRQEFRPRRMARNGHVQTMLARRFPVDNLVVRLEQPMLFDGGPDETGMDPDRPVRLLGYYNPPLRPTRSRGLVLLLHGWGGSSHSSDLQHIAAALLRLGYATIRLNLRDHGPNRHIDTYALNRGVFQATLLNEVAVVTRRIAAMAGDTPLYIVGGSMGGNFALRLAHLHTSRPIPNLARVVTVCPAIEPEATFRAMDSHPPYRRYFRRTWLTALLAKQQRFPDLYDFSSVRHIPSIYAMCEHLIEQTHWRSVKKYFDAYRVSPEMAASLTIPTSIVAAADDAVIPARHFLAFEPHDNLDITIYPTGGHMGFVDILPYRRILPDLVLSLLDPDRATLRTA